jgi:predicted  nucleic acid-binding Zn-ribbon protein
VEGTEAAQETAETVSPLQLLLSVQERDIQLDRIAYRRRESPERKRVSQLQARQAELGRQAATVEADRAVLVKRQAQIDAHVQSLVARVAQIDERLLSSGAGSFRDQQAMGAERESLNAQRVATEDDELDVMELLEPIEAALRLVENESTALAEELSEASAALGEADAELESEASEAAAARADLATGLPVDLSATYERLRAKLGGVGAAKLVSGTCSGCHLTLPSRERDQVVHAPAGTVFYCEQCGRILVP